MKIYLVWERESFEEYDVVLITQDEEKAKQIAGSNNRYWYEEKELETEYFPYN